MTAPLCCPECGLRARDVADGHDPFAADEFIPVTERYVAMSCANGHYWCEYQRFIGRKAVERKTAMKGERFRA